LADFPKENQRWISVKMENLASISTPQATYFEQEDLLIQFCIYLSRLEWQTLRIPLKIRVNRIYGSDCSKSETGVSGIFS